MMPPGDAPSQYISPTVAVALPFERDARCLHCSVTHSTALTATYTGDTVQVGISSTFIYLPHIAYFDRIQAGTI